MDMELDLDLQECPICGGPALLEDENGWCCYIACLDCSAHTVHIEYRTPADRPDSVRSAAHLWNIGKVLTDTPND